MVLPFSWNPNGALSGPVRYQLRGPAYVPVTPQMHSSSAEFDSACVGDISFLISQPRPQLSLANWASISFQCRRHQTSTKRGVQRHDWFTETLKRWISALSTSAWHETHEYVQIGDHLESRSRDARTFKIRYWPTSQTCLTSGSVFLGEF